MASVSKFVDRVLQWRVEVWPDQHGFPTGLRGAVALDVNDRDASQHQEHLIVYPRRRDLIDCERGGRDEELAGEAARLRSSAFLRSVPH